MKNDKERSTEIHANGLLIALGIFSAGYTIREIVRNINTCICAGMYHRSYNKYLNTVGAEKAGCPKPVGRGYVKKGEDDEQRGEEREDTAE